MRVKILKESGYEEALLGLSLSFYDHAEVLEDWWNPEKIVKAQKRLQALSYKGGGHDKAVESIGLHIYIQASRDFWSEFDTYRVGMTKNSSSTMHTLSKRYVNKTDFEVGTSNISIWSFNYKLWQFKNKKIDISELKKNLPEGWLQERVVMTNYKTVQNILAQRSNHKLIQWRDFCSDVLAQAEHPELLNKKGKS